MFTLILQKLIHKRWMVLCLLIGDILLMAVAVSYPLYRTAAFQRMLTEEFDYYRETAQEWPAALHVSHSRSRGQDGLDYQALSQYVDYANSALEVGIKEDIRYLSTSTKAVNPVVARDEKVDRQVRLAYLSAAEEHIQLQAGRLPEDGVMDGGYLEAMVTESVANSLNILLDEIYEMEDTTFSDGSPLRVKIVGIFRAINEQEDYWVIKPSALRKDFLVTEDTFFSLFVGEEQERTYGMKVEIYELWDYAAIEPGQVKDILAATQTLTQDPANGGLLGDNAYEGIIESYSAKAKKVEASLLILQVPVLALLFAFIYMISGQMLSMEQNEISVMKSRGARGRQILRMYLLQSLILGAISLAAGLPLGRLFCSLIGSATDFMEFSGQGTLTIRYTPDVIVYAAGAVLVTVVLTLIPVIQYSRITIVKLKQSGARQKKSLWKRVYLDIICLAISLYGYWSFSRNSGGVMEQVLTGETLDPLLYLSCSLFLLGFGLFALRLQPILLQGIFRLRKKGLSPASYVAFSDAIRGGKRMEFIILFMILTVALGIQDTTVARTIVANAENNAAYISGADVVLKEAWKNNAATAASVDAITYTEPDYGRFSVIEGIEATARVYWTGMDLPKINQSARIMGIYTGEFASVTDMPGGLLPYDYYDYLNVMASGDNVVLVSENFMTKLGYKLGDVLQMPNGDSSVRMVIRGFFNYWPSYSPTSYNLNADGTMTEADNYLIVANLGYLQKELGVKPYEVWMRVGNSSEALYEYVEAEELQLSKLQDLEVIREDLHTDTLFQGTNGILTMSFMVVLVLCAVGYLIYFILSIRSRELLFGVLRAMGMRKREITGMLLLEQIFCGLYAILAGTVIGLAGSHMFVPMIQNAYAASDQVLPLELITSRQDLQELFSVIGIVMLICLFIIARLVAHMNITKALKLGED